MNVINETTIVAALLCLLALVFNLLVKDVITDTQSSSTLSNTEGQYLGHNTNSKFNPLPVVDPLSVKWMTNDKKYWS